jgi:NAD(P)-dependent dehydrogenase (short-subunit alcohol dehydrogenase family)
MSERVAIVAGAGGELGRATAEKVAAAWSTVAGYLTVFPPVVRLEGRPCHPPRPRSHPAQP